MRTMSTRPGITVPSLLETVKRSPQLGLICLSSVASRPSCVTSFLGRMLSYEIAQHRIISTERKLTCSQLR